MARLSRLAAWQWGLLTTAQATREGISRAQLARLESAGVLERVDHGVYAMTAAPDKRRRFEAAWLALDPVPTAEERLADRPPSGAVSHTSAASLHGLGDLLDDVPEVTVPGRRQTRRTIRIHRAPLTPDVTLVDGLPTTTVERTIVDLLRDGHSPDHIAQIVGQAPTRGLLDVDDLSRRLEPLARTYQQRDCRAFVAHLLDIAGAASPGSARAAKRRSSWCGAAAAPPPSRWTTCTHIEGRRHGRQQRAGVVPPPQPGKGQLDPSLVVHRLAGAPPPALLPGGRGRPGVREDE